MVGIVRAQQLLMDTPTEISGENGQNGDVRLAGLQKPEIDKKKNL